MMKMVFSVLGGLGLFLYGMNLMGIGLQKVAGSKMKRLIEVLTNNRLMGVFIGAVVTMLIQSSSATTVMVVGFVNAGLMSLSQAIGVIMGANIGTTITAQLIAFKLTDVAPIMIAIGVAVWMGSSNTKHKDIAEILIGFGILFLGMGMMSKELKTLKDWPMFKQMMVTLKNPFLGILLGFVMTAILQSSSASTAVLIAVASSGAITLDIAFPILFGQNIGTCVTAMLSSLGANKTAKKAALMHLIFNVLGTTIFMILLYTTPMIEMIENFTGEGKVARQIANAHTVFNIANVLILLPFAGMIVNVVEKLVPGKSGVETHELKYLDERIIETPSIAVGMASKEVLRMGKMVKEMLDTAKRGFIESDSDLNHKVFEQEKKINRLEKAIVGYLTELMNAPLTDEQHLTITTLLNTVNDLERVGDHADNIAELAQYALDENVKVSEHAIKELNIMFEKVENAYNTALIAFKAADGDIAKDVVRSEEEIDEMEKQYRANHIARLNQKKCEPNAGIIFLDTISNLERIADHASNISLAIISAVK